MSPLVLLIESDPTIAGLVIEGLRQTVSTISIEQANSVPQALDFLFHTGKYTFQRYEDMPDLIVLSLDLPNDGSMELLRILKAYIRTQRMPILLLAEASTLIPALEKSPLEINRFIIKSENHEEFVSALSSAAAYWLGADSSKQPPPSETTGKDTSADCATSSH